MRSASESAVLPKPLGETSAALLDGSSRSRRGNRTFASTARNSLSRPAKKGGRAPGRGLKGFFGGSSRAIVDAQSCCLPQIENSTTREEGRSRMDRLRFTAPQARSQLPQGHRAAFAFGSHPSWVCRTLGISVHLRGVLQQPTFCRKLPNGAPFSTAQRLLERGLRLFASALSGLLL